MRGTLFRLYVVVLLVWGCLGGASGTSGFAAELDQMRDLTPSLGSGVDVGRDVGAYSNRLIVELTSASLVQQDASRQSTLGTSSEACALDMASASAVSYIAQLKGEQAAFAEQFRTVFPSAEISSYMSASGERVSQQFQIVMNAVVVTPGTDDLDGAIDRIEAMTGVRRVYRDYARKMDMYAGLPLVNAQSAWENSAIGGMANAGAGIKIASVDGGIHHDASMFDGAGYSFPEDFPEEGKGDAANNNGKIIASRAYFRSWDPPTGGDDNTWPGENGTSHGVHTSGIFGGNEITDPEYAGITAEPVSGVAPAAWIMSYRVFYDSVSGDEEVYDAELIAAIEDAVADGADVINLSLGEGPAGLANEYNAVERAMVNAVAAGVLITASAGNSGPGKGTLDHPSDDYITVAASSTAGTYASGRLSVTGPEPVSDELVNLSYTTAEFGGTLETGLAEAYAGTYKMSASVDSDNVDGCYDFPEDAFSGGVAVMRRGSCEFGVKSYNAENAGAELVIIYNSESGGDSLMTMSEGEMGDQVTIPAVFIGHSDGLALEDWAGDSGDLPTLVINTQGFQDGNEPDVIASFSSRGPSAAQTLKPDITAPGVNILSQGYAVGETGEARHLGFGQASGTSMAAPYVAGAGALIRQIHPDWSPADIKSALMSTSDYLEIYDHEGNPAQPLDMGAGRLDLEGAADPGVLLDPPSVSFGYLDPDTAGSVSVTVTNISDSAETYAVSTLYTGDGFDDLQPLSGVSVTPQSFTLEPDQSTDLTVSFDAAACAEAGDNQGFVVLAGTDHDAHFPVWGRVLGEGDGNEILVIDNDGSASIGNPDYAGFYTDALDSLELDYTLYDADAMAGNDSTLPDISDLLTYDAIVYFTGDFCEPDGTYAYSTPLTQLDQDALVEFVNAGGLLIAMGQDMASVLTDSGFLYEKVLGGRFLQDSVSDDDVPIYDIRAFAGAPTAFQELVLDVGSGGDGAENQYYVDEIQRSVLSALEPDDALKDIVYHAFLYYPGTGLTEVGTTGMLHRDQPTLARPGVSFMGRVVYCTFGLEGVNSNTGLTSRSEFLSVLLNWAWDEPVVNVSGSESGDVDNALSFSADFDSPVADAVPETYLWDFGDGIEAEEGDESVDHVYASPGDYTVRCEVKDSYGNYAVGETLISVAEASGNQGGVGLNRNSDGVCFVTTILE